jgi:hypothetical protein
MPLEERRVSFDFFWLCFEAVQILLIYPGFIED